MIWNEREKESTQPALPKYYHALQTVLHLKKKSRSFFNFLIVVFLLYNF